MRIHQIVDEVLIAIECDEENREVLQEVLESPRRKTLKEVHDITTLFLKGNI